LRTPGWKLVSLRRLAPFAAGLAGRSDRAYRHLAGRGVTFFCLAGLSERHPVLDVAGFTLIQRGTDDAVLARVFGAEALVIAAPAWSIIGSLRRFTNSAPGCPRCCRQHPVGPDDPPSHGCSAVDASSSYRSDSPNPPVDPALQPAPADDSRKCRPPSP
jgi:hypothetical protein